MTRLVGQLANTKINKWVEGTKSQQTRRTSLILQTQKGEVPEAFSGMCSATVFCAGKQGQGFDLFEQHPLLVQLPHES